MTDDELDRALRRARPHTVADDGWAASPEGERALSRIHHALASVRHKPASRRPGGRMAWRAGLAAAVAAAIALGLTLPAGSHPHRQAAPPRPPIHSSGPAGPTPQDIQLVAYHDCTAMLAQLRAHTAAHVGPFGLPGTFPSNDYGDLLTAPKAALSAGLDASAPEHSTTNVQEQGVGEPDTIETDGRRIVTVADGVLRVVDVATHAVTGRLDLTVYAGSDSAQLLMAGDRVLVVLGAAGQYYPQVAPARPYGPAGGSTTFLLVDLATTTPKIVSTLHTTGSYVDARMVGDTARLVVQSAPKIVFPTPTGNVPAKQRIAANRKVVDQAPLSAWLPTYDVTDGTSTTTHTVPCEQISHPTTYTGTSMLTVYTADLTGNLDDPQPVTLAADGTAVYASTSSLYVASSAGTSTQLHRFDIAGTAAPSYLGSGTVPGRLFDSYSMSEYAGSLRVVTTGASSTAVYVVDAATLKVRGHVGGLGAGEQLHGVRFLGPLGYVVTFRSVDPLYVLDLRDPDHPRKAGELTATGYSDYLHPVGTGRLLGVGEDVNSAGMVSGLQVSLFDVSSPSHPQRLDRLTRAHTPSETPIDPHAFLYWPNTRTAVMPIDSWTGDESGAVLVVHVGSNGLSTVGTISNPAVSGGGGATGIERTMVIGDDLWTLSSAGLQASDLHSLQRRAWVPFT